MLRIRRALAPIGLCAGLAWAAPAGANPDTPEKDYLLTQPGTGRPTGAQLQIGPGRPLPIGPEGPFSGGQMSMTGLITTRKGGGMMTSTGPAIWPPLRIEPAPSAVTTGAPTPGKRIAQDLSTPQGGALRIPAGVLVLTADGNPRHGRVRDANPALNDIATTLSYSWPVSSATLAPGGGPAPSLPGVFTAMGPGGGTVTYSRTPAGKAFGGPALFALQPGPNAGTRLAPMNGAGMLPVATLFINGATGGPTGNMFAGIVAASTGGLGRAAQGGNTTITTAFGTVPSPLHPVSAMITFMAPCTMWCLGPNGTIRGLPNEHDDHFTPNPPGTTITTWSVGPGFGTLTHDDGTSQGFPWTTGFITVYAPGALGGQTFFLVGSDMRGSTATGMTGVGNLSLVSGALSTRNLSKANANRGWLSLNLPEPEAALGTAGALGMLALVRALARGRRRR